MKRRSQLVEMRKMEKNRLEQTHASQKASVAALIAHLGERIVALDKDIDRYNKNGFDGKGEILSETKGVGNTTCAPYCR